MRTSATLDHRRMVGGALVLAIVLFVAVNVFSNLTFTAARLDLTEDALFTVSDGTREVLAAIDEPVVLRLFLSEVLAERAPGLAGYADRVRELLQHYASLAQGNIRLEVYHPEPFSIEEDRALSFGLQGIPVTSSGDLAYFGLAGTNSTDDTETIALFTPRRDSFLEYDLTRLIHDLSRPEKPTVGVVSSLPIAADPTRRNVPWLIYGQMRGMFTIRDIGGDFNAIDDAIDTMMVVQPSGLGEPALYALDQFVLRGGKLLAFVDPFGETAMQYQQRGAPPPTDHGLERLFEAWGIEMTAGKLVGDRLAAQRVNARVQGRNVVTEYLPWLALRSANFNADEVILSEIAQLNIASAGILRAKDDAAATLTPLISSSAESMRLEVDKVRYLPDPTLLLSEFEPAGERFTMAARIGGVVDSAFPDGPPAPLDDAGPEHLARSAEPINVVVVADTDLLADHNWARVDNLFGQPVIIPFANNADFVLNALDNLSGSSALIGLRGRGLSARPFDTVDAIAREAEHRYRAKEQELTQKLGETENKIRNLQFDEAGGEIILSDEQVEIVESFRAESVSIRAQLREVQHALRSDIDRLDAWLKVINIGAIPLLICLIALALAATRRMRTRRRMAPHVG